MGRAPCCDKANVKKGPWSPEEDAKLKSYIEQHGTGGNWIALPQKIGLKRCGKSCRLRWLNYLRPNIKHGGFSDEEDNIICSLYISIGSRWSIIAAQLPGRTDNDIKNYWNTRLKKKLLGKQRKERPARGARGKRNATTSCNSSNPISSDQIGLENIINPVRAAYEPPRLNLPPIPYSNEEPRFNDHASIRKLLIKLGGRFSDDQMINNPDVELYGSLVSHDLTAPNPLHHTGGPQFNDMNGLDTTTTNTTTTTITTSSVFQEKCIGLEPEVDIHGLMLYENQQKMRGLEFYDEDIIFNGTSSYGQITDWGATSSLVIPTVVSSDNNNNNNNIVEGNFVQLQGIPTSVEEFVVDKMSFFGSASQ